MNRRTQNIHERFIRHIWSKQYLTGKLQTVEGKPLEVLDVGRLNEDGGPDFRNAKIKLNGVTYSGDIEIHRTVFDWFEHQHQEDPRYNKVILHVVLETAGSIPATVVHSGRHIPILELGRFLCDSIHAIWQKVILDERAKKLHALPCFPYNGSVSSLLLDRWLAKLAAERLELKLRRFEERLKQLAYEYRMILHEHPRPYGSIPCEGEHNEIPQCLPELTQKDLSSKDLWEQLLYEGIMEGLGFAKNRRPFLHLAENLTLKKIAHLVLLQSDSTIESLLFGVANLLPASKSLTEKEARQYVRMLHLWWRKLRPQYRGEILQPADWQFFPTRPTNFPTVRLAAAGVIVNKFLKEDFFRSIVQVLKTTTPAAEKMHVLLRLFTIETNDFWKHHYTFQTTASTTVTALGVSRKREIIINAVLPICLLYARIFKDKTVHEGVFDLYRYLPASENNFILRLMERQVLKGRLPVKSVDRQQALIHLYAYYCAEGRCTDCELGTTLPQ
jgi:hypothetical protein